MEAVLQVLEADWRDPLRCTNVEQALHRAGLPFRDSDRRRIAQVILKDPRRADLLRWHPSAYFLTNEERLVARAMLGFLAGSVAQDDLVRRVCGELSLREDTVRVALDALVWIGFLEQAHTHLRLSPRALDFLEGVGFYFHEVVAGQERFNVNCFHDFVLLTSPSYRAQRLQKPFWRGANRPGMTPKMLAFLEQLDPRDLIRRTYEEGVVHLRDACAYCLARIILTVSNGQLVSSEPRGVWHVRGGGCGVNNLFCGPACAEGWVRVNPHLLHAEWGPAEVLWYRHGR